MHRTSIAHPNYYLSVFVVILRTGHHMFLCAPRFISTLRMHVLVQFAAPCELPQEPGWQRTWSKAGHLPMVEGGVRRDDRNKHRGQRALTAVATELKQMKSEVHGTRESSLITHYENLKSGYNSFDSWMKTLREYGFELSKPRVGKPQLLAKKTVEIWHIKWIVLRIPQDVLTAVDKARCEMEMESKTYEYGERLLSEAEQKQRNETTTVNVVLLKKDLCRLEPYSEWVAPTRIEH